MKQDVIQWKLDGEGMKKGEGVDLFIYAESMKLFGESMKEMCSYTGSGHLKIRIIEAKKGSLLTLLGMVIDPNVIGTIFTNFSSIKDLIDFFVQYTDLMKFFGSDTPSIKIGHDIKVNTDIGNGKVKLENSNGNNITVNSNVYNIYLDRPAIRKTVANGFDLLSRDGAIDKLAVEYGDSLVKEFTKEDFNEFATMAEPTNKSAEDTIQTKTEMMSLFPSKVVFDSKTRKWEFVITTQGRKISARILDEKFWTDVADKSKDFTAGPYRVFHVEIRYQKIKDPITGIYMIDENTYEIIKVLEIKSFDQDAM